jgi:hypothetical protein
MATVDTHLEIATNLRARAGALREADDSASNHGEYTGHCIKIVGYEIAAALHGLTALGYLFLDRGSNFLVCTDCERKSWASKVGDGCGMLQPDGSRCGGMFA